MACALKHHTGRGEPDPERWQMTSQLATLALIRDAGFALPPNAEAWDGLTVEQAYDRLQAPGRQCWRRRQSILQCCRRRRRCGRATFPRRR